MAGLKDLFRVLEGASDLAQGVIDARDQIEGITQVLQEEGTRKEPLSPEDPPLIQGAKLVDAYAKRVSARSRPAGEKLVADLDKVRGGLRKIRGK